MSSTQWTVQGSRRNIGRAIAALLLAATIEAWAGVTVSLTAPANGSTYVPPVNITLSASASADQGYTVSKVEFFYGTTLIGTDVTAPYSVTWNNAPSGVHALAAKATAIKKNSPDETAISAARSITVNARPVVNMTSPVDYSTYTVPPPTVTVSATASDSDGTIDRVDFYDCTSSGALITTITAPPYTFQWTLQPPYWEEESGKFFSYGVIAYAIDNLGGFDTTGCTTVELAPTVTLTSPANGSNFNAPATINLAADILPANVPLDKMEFYGGTTLIGEDTSAPYSFSWQNVPVGTYSLTVKAVSYGGTWTSPSVNVTVSAASAQPKLHYIQVDHLNTPRLVADATGTTVWRWDQQEPFGSTPPNDNPSGLGAFEFPLRFPGQYFDKETGLHYNDFRDYFAEIGRYVESDPIGLRGGLNTYAYVQGSPVTYVDPSGLDAKVCHFPGGPTHIGFGVGSLSTDIQTSGFYPQKHRTPVGKGTIKKDDPSESGTQCKGVVTTPKQDDCLTRCQKRYEDDPGRYHFLRRNCSDYVYTCLRECGLPPGADSFWPKTLYDSVSGTPIPATGIPIFYP